MAGKKPFISLFKSLLNLLRSSLSIKTVAKKCPKSKAVQQKQVVEEIINETPVPKECRLRTLPSRGEKVQKAITTLNGPEFIFFPVKRIQLGSENICDIPEIGFRVKRNFMGEPIIEILLKDEIYLVSCIFNELAEVGAPSNTLSLIAEKRNNYDHFHLTIEFHDEADFICAAKYIKDWVLTPHRYFTKNFFIDENEFEGLYEVRLEKMSSSLILTIFDAENKKLIIKVPIKKQLTVYTDGFFHFLCKGDKHVGLLLCSNNIDRFAAHLQAEGLPYIDTKWEYIFIKFNTERKERKNSNRRLRMDRFYEKQLRKIGFFHKKNYF